MQNSFLIAAPSSNSGKTIITLGLIQALKNKGLKIQPFKCGPDYIDPIHHTEIAGKSSYNLDVWMSDEQHVKEVFSGKMESADVGIVEGVMGLFDGAKRDKGSSAEIAQILNLPVILIVNAAATAYSVAPLLYGFKNFNPKVNIQGVIFNRVSGESHYQFLKEAAEDAQVTSLGYVPKNEKLTLESRHLGLSLTQSSDMKAAVDCSAELIEKHVDLEKLLRISDYKVQSVNTKQWENTGSLRFAVACDEAFNFMYPANIDRLKELGEVLFFSPLRDKTIPDADLVWLPGGYPELFAKELSENTAMIEAIKQFERNGGKIVAECGGMMYLGKGLELQENSIHRMTGIFSYVTSLNNMKLKLGYRLVEANGYQFKGHEFHYSSLELRACEAASYVAKSARGKEVDMPIFKCKNCWSSYFHIYLGQANKMKQFIELVTNKTL